MSTEIRNTKAFHAKSFGSTAEKARHALSKRNVERYKKLKHDALSELEATSVLHINEPGYLEPEEGERTYHISQSELLKSVDLGTKRKVFNLQLSLGPYFANYTRDGRYMLLGGSKGQLALFDIIDMKPFFDISVKQTIRAVQFLDNHELMAVAQKKYVHIYDNHGMEVYVLRDLGLTYQLDYMAPFWLLTSIGEFGELAWQDVSSGQVVARYKTRKGPCRLMRHNKDNGVVHLGHGNGVVTLWTPNQGRPAVEMLAHRGPVVSMAIHQNYMATSGVDGYWSTWDLRNYSKSIHVNFIGKTPPQAMTVSQIGILGMALGGRVEFYRDVFTAQTVKAPGLYLRRMYHGDQVNDIQFQPFEDICAVGTGTGLSTMLVPGAGIANFDAYEPNPYESSSKRQVQRLLDKIPYDTITLKHVDVGDYNRDHMGAVVDDKVDSGGTALMNRRKRRKPLKASTAQKLTKYERTFQRRQQAAKDRLKRLRSLDVAPEEAKRRVVDALTYKDSDGGRRVKGDVDGAALSRSSALR
uniref:BING4 C-terminal domain-containing protein n=1 Tax=Babesia bovis TaxID=5865 RepID=S6BIA2_BABBO|nr:conserved hypothetical protein [Babesia bovis]